MIEALWKQVKFYYNELEVLPGKLNGFNIILARGYFLNYVFPKISVCVFVCAICSMSFVHLTDIILSDLN